MAQINIGFSRFSAFYSPLILTKAAGFLKEEGLEPEFTKQGKGPTMRQMVESGDLHLTQSAVSSSWAPLEQGKSSPIVHFAQVNQMDGFFLAAKNPDPNFSWDKLKGAKVLVDHGGQPLAMFKYACHRQGLDYAGIDAIDAGDGAAIDKAFRDGKADYVHQQGPAPQQLEHDGVGHVVCSVGKAIGKVAFSSLAATGDFLKTDMAQAFMRAYRKARALVNEAPADEIARIERDFFPDIDPAVLAATIEYYQGLGNWNPQVEIDREGYEAALDVFEHAGKITKRHPYEQVVAAPPA